MNEKKELQGLNCKLEVYIERMRQRELGSGGVTYEEISSVIDMFERNVAELRGSLDDANKENTRLKIELGKYKSQADSRDDLKRRIAKLEKELAAARERIQDLEATLSFQSEEKRILKADLEKRVDKLNQQLLFKDKDLKEVREELRKLLAGHTLDIDKISARIRMEYEEKLEKLRRDLREQHKYDMDQLRLNLESQFSSEKSRLVVRIKDLEMQLEKERDLHRQQLAALRGQRDSLEREIAEYRKLLEAEELRLNVDLTPNTLAKKRRRVLETTKAMKAKRRREAVMDTISSSSSTGLVSIIDADPDGDFIKLHNNADDDQSMGGWHVKRTVDDDEEVSYKFPSKYVLKKDKEVTIWASGAGRSHNPPNHLVFRSEESWGSGDHMETKLVDGSGEVMATRLVQRESSANYEEVTGYADTDSPDGYEDVDGDEGSRCKIM
ncbi:lamin-A-like [Amphiura filiformis]|uniref:lamin-A-like n=1 Tax=Amphiura filiformis TaxID=82378 RepID=UPI003B21EF24